MDRRTRAALAGDGAARFRFAVVVSVAAVVVAPGRRSGARTGIRTRVAVILARLGRMLVLDLDVGLYTRTMETRHTLVMLVDGREVFRKALGGPDSSAIAPGAMDSRYSDPSTTDLQATVKPGSNNITLRVQRSP